MQFGTALRAFADSGAEFIVIGGLCSIFHGSARVTYDLDICYSRAGSNLRRVAAALAPFHPRPRNFPEGVPFIWDEQTLRNASILTLQTDLGEIDLIAEVLGLGTFETLAPDAITVEAFGRTIRTLDLPALILAKRATGREKDLAALPELESLLETRD